MFFFKKNCAFLSILFLFFPFVTEKDKKNCFNPDTNDFAQQTVCGASIRWSKYTTIIVSTNMLTLEEDGRVEKF